MTPATENSARTTTPDTIATTLWPDATPSLTSLRILTISRLDEGGSALPEPSVEPSIEPSFEPSVDEVGFQPLARWFRRSSPSAVSLRKCHTTNSVDTSVLKMRSVWQHLFEPDRASRHDALRASRHDALRASRHDALPNRGGQRTCDLSGRAQRLEVRGVIYNIADVE